MLLRGLPHGLGIVIDVLVGTFLGDTGAYLGGRMFGQRPLAPRISPNKTVEGLLIGMVFAVLGVWIAHLYQDWLPGGHALVLGLGVALVAPLGSDNPHNVIPLTSLASLDNRTGDRDGALAATERGLAIIAATGDSELRFIPTLLVERGRALLAKGDAEGARASCERAVHTQEGQELIDPDKTYQDDGLTCLGDAELARYLTQSAPRAIAAGEPLPPRPAPVRPARRLFRHGD